MPEKTDYPEGDDNMSLASLSDRIFINEEEAQRILNAKPVEIKGHPFFSDLSLEPSKRAAYVKKLLRKEE